MRNKTTRNQQVLNQVPPNSNNFNEVAAGEIFLDAPRFDPATGTFAKQRVFNEKLVTYQMPMP